MMELIGLVLLVVLIDNVVGIYEMKKTWEGKGGPYDHEAREKYLRGE